MSTPLRPSPLSFDNPSRKSPFKRQNSASPAPTTARASTPPTGAQSPARITAPNLSPTKAGSLSPEKTSPFVRRPSQIGQTSERPTSPFARPGSSLSVPGSPSRQTSSASRDGETPPASPRREGSVRARDEEETIPTPSPMNASPNPFDVMTTSPAPDSPSAPLPSQADLRPVATRTTTSTSASSTVKPPQFDGASTFPKPTSTTTTTTTTTKPVPPTTAPTSAGKGGASYTNIPPTLLHSMRESFEVLDSANTGHLNSASVATMLEQMGMDATPATLRDYFPPNTTTTTPPNASHQQLNLATYLDTLSAPLTSLSPPYELAAAFAAFDVDDSGQIDVGELRRAVLETAPEPGEEDLRLGEREVEGILGEFAGRRAFGGGGKGLGGTAGAGAGAGAAKGKGEVFRWREFVGAVGGGVGGEQREVMV